jgi:hypothetical protein
MTKQTAFELTTKRGRGRPRKDTEAVTVRLSREVLIALLDEARFSISPQFPPKRARVVRAAVVEWPKGRGKPRA